METQPSVQSSFQKLNFDNNCQKTRKIREQIFEPLSKFTGFLYFVPNILSRIVDHWSKNGSFNKKVKKKNRGYKESMEKMERKALNIGNFSRYLGNCSQVWFKIGPADSNFL